MKANSNKVKEILVAFNDKLKELGEAALAAYEDTVLKIENEALPFEKKPMEECSWSEIKQIIKSGHADKYFKVGDEKTEELFTGEKITIKLISLNPHDELHRQGQGGEKARAAFMFYIDGEYEMNEKATNAGGWRDSKMRNVYMQRFFTLLPAELQEVIEEVLKSCAMSDEDEARYLSVDKLFLLSEAEITGENNCSVEGEGELYEWFKENKLPNKWTWLRSPNPTTSTTFAYWLSNGYVNTTAANSANRVALCFCM